MATPRKKIPDMPVALIALHPRVVYLPQAARGMLWSLVFYHWITGKPIPETDQGVLAILLAHQPTWKAHKEEFEERKKEIGRRPLLRDQAFGESLDPDKLERLGRYEVHLDRKLERMLSMLFRLKELRQGRAEG
jgi:hypothetical protein